MPQTLLPDNSQTVERLHSMVSIMEWMHELPQPARQQLGLALADCNPQVQQVLTQMLAIIENRQTTVAQRMVALESLTNAFCLHTMPTVRPKPETQQTNFAEKLREWMEIKCLSQQELASRVGCSQPAISQMLSRSCRPQKKTLLKLAEALGLLPQELWPDLEVAEMLDAVANFQQEDQVMSPAEAASLAAESSRNRPKIAPQALPSRRK